MAMLHVVDLGKVKVEVELRLGLSGGLDDVAGKVRLLADALAGRMVEGEALADADEQLAKVREELAVAKLDMDRARTELADAQEQIVSLSKQLQASRSAHSAQCCKTDDLREQILSLEKQLSSAAGMSAGSPPRGPDVLAVEDVQDSPAAVKVAGPPSSTEAVAGEDVSQEDPELRAQVASEDGSAHDAGPQGHCAAPCGGPSEVDGQRVPGEGATASPAAANDPLCLAPDCPNKALGKLENEVCQLHQAAPRSVRVEWCWNRYPETKPKPAPASSLRKRKAAANV